MTNFSRGLAPRQLAELDAGDTVFFIDFANRILYRAVRFWYIYKGNDGISANLFIWERSGRSAHDLGTIDRISFKPDTTAAPALRLRLRCVPGNFSTPRPRHRHGTVYIVIGVLGLLIAAAALVLLVCVGCQLTGNHTKPATLASYTAVASHGDHNEPSANVYVTRDDVTQSLDQTGNHAAVGNNTDYMSQANDVTEQSPYSYASHADLMPRSRPTMPDSAPYTYASHGDVIANRPADGCDKQDLSEIYAKPNKPQFRAKPQSEPAADAAATYAMSYKPKQEAKAAFNPTAKQVTVVVDDETIHMQENDLYGT